LSYITNNNEKPTQFIAPLPIHILLSIVGCTQIYTLVNNESRLFLIYMAKIMR
jgi:hypothetical protein